LAILVGNAFLLYSIFRWAPSFAKLISSVEIFGFGTLIYGNVKGYSSMQNRMDELREDLQQLETYERNVNEIYKRIQDVRNFAE
jgi:hypothetical protein